MMFPFIWRKLHLHFANRFPFLVWWVLLSWIHLNINWKDCCGSWSFSSLATWYKEPKANSLEKTLMLGKIEGKRRRGQQRMRWLDTTSNSVDLNSSKLWETVEDRGTGRAQAMRSPRVGHDLATEEQQLSWKGIGFCHIVPSASIEMIMCFPPPLSLVTCVFNWLLFIRWINLTLLGLILLG